MGYIIYSFQVLNFPWYNLLTLNRQPDISHQNEFMWEQQRIIIWDMQSNGEQCEGSEKEKADTFSYGLRGGVAVNE